MSTPLIISFVGPSGVGKTTLIERLIPILRSAGHRVGTVKHAPHGCNVDRTGSDSWRHRAAGADAVLLAGRSGSVVFLGPPDDEVTSDSPDVRTGHHLPTEPETLDWITTLVGTHFRDIDIVLAEGYAPLHDALVELQRTGGCVNPRRRDRRGALVPGRAATAAGRPLAVTDVWTSRPPARSGSARCSSQSR